MKKFKKVLGIYFLFGIMMAVYVSTVNSVFDILVIRGGMSVLKYILLTGCFLGLFWLPYGMLLVITSYPKYYVFGDTPVCLIAYMLLFVLVSLYIILRKQNDTERGTDLKNITGLFKFCAVLLMTIVFAVTTLFTLPEPTINKENIRSLSFAYGAGPQWHHTYNLNYRGDIDAVIDALIQLPLESAQSCEFNNDLLASDEIAFVVAIHYEDIKKAKENNEIGFYIVLDNGHIIVEDFYKQDRHYRADYTALQTVLNELEWKAKIGFMSMTRN